MRLIIPIVLLISSTQAQSFLFPQDDENKTKRPASLSSLTNGEVGVVCMATMREAALVTLRKETQGQAQINQEKQAAAFLLMNKIWSKAVRSEDLDSALLLGVRGLLDLDEERFRYCYAEANRVQPQSDEARKALAQEVWAEFPALVKEARK